MKRVFHAALVFALAAAVCGPVLTSPETMEGVVSDPMCGKKHMLPGKTDAQCTKECLKASGKYALVAGNKMYTLSGAVSEVEKYAGRKVRIAGDVDGNAIRVNSVAEASH